MSENTSVKNFSKAGAEKLREMTENSETYVDFLKYAVKNYNATIVDSKYPYIVFTNSKDCDAIVKELNKRWELIEKYRRNKQC